MDLFHSITESSLYNTFSVFQLQVVYYETQAPATVHDPLMQEHKR